MSYFIVPSLGLQCAVEVGSWFSLKQVCIGAGMINMHVCGICVLYSCSHWSSSFDQRESEQESNDQEKLKDWLLLSPLFLLLYSQGPGIC